MYKLRIQNLGTVVYSNFHLYFSKLNFTMKPSKFISPVTFALPFHQSLHPPKFPSYHTQLSSVGTETSTSPLSPYGFSIFIWHSALSSAIRGVNSTVNWAHSSLNCIKATVSSLQCGLPWMHKFKPLYFAPGVVSASYFLIVPLFHVMLCRPYVLLCKLICFSQPLQYIWHIHKNKPFWIIVYNYSVHSIP